MSTLDVRNAELHTLIDPDAPIERIRTAGSDDDIALTFVNADSGELYGVELEGLKSLPGGFFVAGNLTLSDSELMIDTGGITGGPTNSKRRLTGHSEWVINTTLGTFWGLLLNLPWVMKADWSQLYGIPQDAPIPLIAVWLVVEAFLALRRYRREGPVECLDVTLPEA